APDGRTPRGARGHSAAPAVRSRDSAPERPTPMTRSILALLFCLLPAVVATHAPAGAEDAEISARRAAERKNFTDAEITRGFFKTVFGAELRLRGRTDVIRKYDGPVRVFIDSRAKPDRRADVIKVIDDIRSRVDHLDIAVTDDRDAANFIVTVVRERDFTHTVRTMYGRDKAKRIARLEPQCL